MASSASSGIFRYLEETTPKTVESGGPQVYRVTDGTLTQSTESAEDNELRADRGRGASTLVSGSVGGSLNINWSHKTHDDFLEALLADEFVTAGTGGVATVTDMAFDTTTHTISSAGGNLPLLELGQYFTITGANNSANDLLYRASSSTAPTTSAIVVDTTVNDVAATDTAASTDLSSSRLKQGNDDLRTFTLERELSDASQYFSWAGTYVSSLNLSYSISAKVSGSFNFLGTDTEVRGTSSIFPGIGSEVAATTTPHFNSTSDSMVIIDGSALGDSCTESFTLDISGNLRERRCIGSGLAASSVGTDPFSITGQISVFFGSSASATLYDKHLEDQTISFTTYITDPENNVFAVTVPKGRITAAEVTGGAIGSDVMLNITFMAETDSDFGTMIMIDRCGASVA